MLSENEKSFLSDGLDAGIPEADLVAKIKASRAKAAPAKESAVSPSAEPEYTSIQGIDIPTDLPDAAAPREHPGLVQGSKDVISSAMPYARMPLAGTAAALSELALSPAIAATGPAAPGAALIVGTTAYTTADKILGEIEDWANDRDIDWGSAEDTTEDLAFNIALGAVAPAALGLAGKGIGKTGGALWGGAKKIPIVGKIPEAVEGAGKWLYDSIAHGDLRKELEAAEALSKTMPKEGTPAARSAAGERAATRSVQDKLSQEAGGEMKLKFGQAENDPNMLNLTSGVNARNPTEAATMQRDMHSGNLKLINNYLKKKLPKGADVKKLLSSIKEIYEANATQTQASKEALEDVASAISKMPDDDIFANTLRNDFLKPGKKIVRDAADKLYKDLPVIPVEGKNAEEPILKVLAEATKSENDMNLVPTKIMNDILESARYGDMTFQRVNNWIKSLNRFMKSPDYPKQYWGGRVKSVLEDLEKSVADYYPAVRKARDNWSEYSSTWREGPIGQALKRGEYDGYKLTASDVVSKFLNTEKPELANNLIKALGKDKGRKMIRDMALLDFRKSAMKGGEIDPKAAQNWVDKAGKLLKRYDIDVPDVKSALMMVEDAAKTSKEFQNSALGNVLGKNPEEVIGSIFSGERALSSREVMGEIVNLLKKTKGDKAANEGLKNAFKKFIFEESMTPQGEEMAFDTIYKNMKRFEPAMKMLYKPEELTSMRTARKALDILRRGEKGSSGLGSTAEDEVVGLIPSFLRILGLKGRFAAKVLSTLGGNKKAAEQFLMKAVNEPE
jgi:hypothetical protein